MLRFIYNDGYRFIWIYRLCPDDNVRHKKRLKGKITETQKLQKVVVRHKEKMTDKTLVLSAIRR